MFAAFPDKHGAPQSSLRGQSYEKLPKYSALSADINRHLWPLCIPAGPEQWECARQYKPPFYLTLLVLFLCSHTCQKRNTGNKRRNLFISFHWDWEFCLCFPRNQAWPVPSACSKSTRRHPQGRGCWDLPPGPPVLCRRKSLLATLRSKGGLVLWGTGRSGK